MQNKREFIEMLHMDFESSRDEYLNLSVAITLATIERRLVAQRLEALKLVMKRQGFRINAKTATDDFLGKPLGSWADGGC